MLGSSCGALGAAVREVAGILYFPQKSEARRKGERSETTQNKYPRENSESSSQEFKSSRIVCKPNAQGSFLRSPGTPKSRLGNRDGTPHHPPSILGTVKGDTVRPAPTLALPRFISNTFVNTEAKPGPCPLPMATSTKCSPRTGSDRGRIGLAGVGARAQCSSELSGHC